MLVKSVELKAYVGGKQGKKFGFAAFGSGYSNRNIKANPSAADQQL